MKIKTLSVVATILITLVAQVAAQKGVVKGRVFDAFTNEPLPFTNIVIFGTTIGSTSDLDGNFLFTGVEPGFVRLQATMIGYAPYSSEDFLVTNAKTVTVSIPMQPAAVTLEKVEIKASLFEQRAESPVSMRRLDISEIEKNPGGNRDISKVLQSLPGVASSVSFRNDLIVRGGGPSENRFFIDDIEIPNLNHFATQGASGGPVGIVNVDFIREVDFYSGAFPANRGNALSSMVEMRQMDGNPDKVNFRATVGASDLALALDGPLGKKSSFVFSVRRSYLQFLFSAIGLPFLPTYNDYQLKYKVRFDKKNELSIVSLGAYDQFKLNTGIENPDEDQRYILGYLPVNSQWNYAIGAVYKHFRSNGFDTWVVSRNMLRNSAYKYRDNDESSENNKILDYTSDEIENKFRYERTLLSGVYKFNFGAGAEYARYFNNTFQKIVVAGNAVRDLRYQTNLDLLKGGVFGQVTRPLLNDRLTLSLGLRLDANNYNTAMNNPVDQFSPRFSASYLLAEKWAVNFNVGRFYQLPSYTTMGYRDLSNTLVNKENGLSYIGANHFVAGLEYRPDENSRVTLEGFYKTYDNYPFSIADSVSLASKAVDFGVYGDEAVTSTSKGRAYGFELLARTRDLKGFNIIMSYTFVRSEFTNKDQQYIPSAWDNKHIVNLTATRQFKRNWNLGMKWRFVGGAPYTPYDLDLSSDRQAWDARGRGYLDYARFNTLRLGNFHQLDVRVDKQYFFNQWSLRVYLDVQNLYNFKADQPDNLTNLSPDGVPVVDPADPDRYVLRAIENTAGQALPTIGLIVEF
ncbi:MAG: TonB-dependent receptor [Bacteroidales bacterium]|nr:TonB-dependent receptor [Bacteroidales bacterium]